MNKEKRINKTHKNDVTLVAVERERERESLSLENEKIFIFCNFIENILVKFNRLNI